MTDSLLPLFDLIDGVEATDAASAASQTPVQAPVQAPTAACLGRIVADSNDRVAWLRARSRGITATDVAKLATPRSIAAAALDKLHGSGFTGNSWTDHGRAREPVIAEWVLANHGIAPSSSLFHAEEQRLHLATPDGIVVRANGHVELAEIKTTSKAWRSIPRSYLRQVWWQQYVLGAERTLVVWEQHTNFVPLSEVPESRWVDRDDEQIAALIGLADELVTELRNQTQRNQAKRAQLAQRRELYGPGALTEL